MIQENKNKVHKKFISKGLFNKDIRKDNPEIYEKECFDALKKDFEKNETNNSNFYALVIKTKK